MSKLIYVKDTPYPNRCSYCKNEIPAHSESWWNKSEGKNYHTICKPKDNANPKTTEADGVPHENDDTPVAIEAKVEGRLRKAKQIVDEVFEDQGELDYSLYAHLIAEVSHQLFAEAISRQIQTNKEHNLKVMK